MRTLDIDRDMKPGDIVVATMRGVTKERQVVLEVPGDGTVVLQYQRTWGSKGAAGRRGGVNRWLAGGWRVTQTAEQRVARELMA